jgi:hypothetical protein
MHRKFAAIQKNHQNSILFNEKIPLKARCNTDFTIYLTGNTVLYSILLYNLFNYCIRSVLPFFIIAYKIIALLLKAPYQNGAVPARRKIRN